MLETLLIRSRATPSEPPRRRGATSLGPERDRFGVLKGVLAAVPWLQVFGAPAPNIHLSARKGGRGTSLYGTVRP